MAAIDFLLGIWIGTIIAVMLAIWVLLEFQERVFGRR